MFQHLQRCEKLLETITYQLPDIDPDVSTVNLQAHIDNAISDNWKILDSNTNWVSNTNFLESYYIKQIKPKINDGLKVSKEILLFR